MTSEGPEGVCVGKVVGEEAECDDEMAGKCDERLFGCVPMPLDGVVYLLTVRPRGEKMERVQSTMEAFQGLFRPRL